MGGVRREGGTCCASLCHGAHAWALWRPRTTAGSAQRLSCQCAVLSGHIGDLPAHAGPPTAASCWGLAGYLPRTLLGSPLGKATPFCLAPHKADIPLNHMHAFPVPPPTPIVNSRTAPANFWTFLRTFPSPSVYECSQAVGNPAGTSANAWALLGCYQEWAKVSAGWATPAGKGGPCLASCGPSTTMNGPLGTSGFGVGRGQGGMHTLCSTLFPAETLLRNISEPVQRWVMGISVDRSFCQHCLLRRSGVYVTQYLHLWGFGQNSATPGKVHLPSHRILTMV